MSPRMSTICRRTGASVVAALVLLTVAVTARAQEGGSARAEREQVRGQRAQLALQINALQADDASLDRATRDIEENLRGQQALATDAERAARDAAQASVEAQAAADAKAAEVDALQARMTQFAVDAYVNPPGNDALDRLKADNATDAARKGGIARCQRDARE